MESPLSVVDDLRVVDVRVDPASPTPGEAPVVEPLVLDAFGDGFETWSWWCVDGACGTEPLSAGAFATVRVLACSPGLCAGPGPDLADPASWLVDLPFEGVSLAERRVPLSPSAEMRLNENPVFSVAPVLPEVAGPGEEVVIDLAASDSTDQVLVGWLYATAGGVPEASVTLEAGAGSLTWVAPDDPGEVQVSVIVDDGLGGSVQHSGTVRVGN